MGVVRQSLGGLALWPALQPRVLPSLLETSLSFPRENHCHPGTVSVLTRLCEPERPIPTSKLRKPRPGDAKSLPSVSSHRAELPTPGWPGHPDTARLPLCSSIRPWAAGRTWLGSEESEKDCSACAPRGGGQQPLGSQEKPHSIVVTRELRGFKSQPHRIPTMSLHVSPPPSVSFPVKWEEDKAPTSEDRCEDHLRWKHLEGQLFLVKCSGTAATGIAGPPHGWHLVLSLAMPSGCHQGA